MTDQMGGQSLANLTTPLLAHILEFVPVPPKLNSSAWRSECRLASTCKALHVAQAHAGPSAVFERIRIVGDEYRLTREACDKDAEEYFGDYNEADSSALGSTGSVLEWGYAGSEVCPQACAAIARRCKHVLELTLVVPDDLDPTAQLKIAEQVVSSFPGLTFLGIGYDEAGGSLGPQALRCLLSGLPNLRTLAASPHAHSSTSWLPLLAACACPRLQKVVLPPDADDVTTFSLLRAVAAACPRLTYIDAGSTCGRPNEPPTRHGLGALTDVVVCSVFMEEGAGDDQWINLLNWTGYYMM